MLVVRIGTKWYVPDDSINLRQGEMLAVCCVCGAVNEIKTGCTSGASISDGYCQKCLGDVMKTIKTPLGKTAVATHPATRPGEPTI